MDSPPTDLNYVVRYGTTRIVGEFTARGFPTLARGASVVVRSDRGHELGTVLCPASAQTRTYLNSDEEHGRIVRFPNDEDEAYRTRALQLEQEAFLGCRDLIRERSLQMQLIDVEQIIGGERLIFYYVSEARVDFRELVKSLAKLYHLRIEMRQIGIRDEAKLLADYGDCGQPVCCNTFLREMPPVSMKMAKLQKATLDPSKISGRCGRLKCCLRYEYDTYEEHRKELPPVGATVVTKQGTGKVVGQELLARKLMISYEGQRNVMTDEKDVITVISHKSTKPTSPNGNQSGGPAPSAGGAPHKGADPATDKSRRDDGVRERPVDDSASTEQRTTGEQRSDHQRGKQRHGDRHPNPSPENPPRRKEGRRPDQPPRDQNRGDQRPSHPKPPREQNRGPRERPPRSSPPPQQEPPQSMPPQTEPPPADGPDNPPNDTGA